MPDATHPTSIKHRWLEDDAVVLQLREVNQTEGSILDHAPDRDVAKALLVSLCLIRQSGDLRSSLERVLAYLQKQPGWTTFVSWMIMMKTQVTTNSADYPFSLSDDEFEYLSTQYFKGRIQVARSLYKPPSFYKLLASNISTILIGAVAASVAIAAAPEVTGASIFSLPALGVAGTRSAITAVSGAIGNALLPSVSVSDYIVGRKWPHYLAEWQRRQLA